ncbi:MAG: hypothetical protein WDO24_28260 [Pseudomonadota bacterium]
MMMSFAYWEPVIIISMLNVILVSGLYITAMSGQLSMATAAIAGVGGYAAAVLTTNFEWPFLPAILAGAVGGMATGALLALVTLKMRDFILKLTTLAFGEALSVVVYNIGYLGGANSFSGIALYTDLTTVMIGVAVALYIAWRFDGSRLGFAARRCATIRWRRRPTACRCARRASSPSRSVLRSSAWAARCRRITCW